MSTAKNGTGHRYGTQYKSFFTLENMKFITKSSRQSETLMETMTKGRVYATIGGKEIIRITFFDNGNKRNKVIEKDSRTGIWHAHLGYEHNEYSEKKHLNLTVADKRIVDKAQKAWHNYLRANGRAGALRP